MRWAEEPQDFGHRTQVYETEFLSEAYQRQTFRDVFIDHPSYGGSLIDTPPLLCAVPCS